MNTPVVMLISSFLAIFFIICPVHGTLPVDTSNPQIDKTHDLCARGVSEDPHRPFIKHARVKLTLRGATPNASILKSIQAELIRQQLWARQASRAYVEEFKMGDCPAIDSRLVELTIELDAEALAEIEARIVRGDFGVTGLARDSSVHISSGMDPSQAPTSWMRIYYATNRQVEQNKNNVYPLIFGSERVDELSYGEVNVAVHNEPTMRDNQSAAVFRVDKVSGADSFSVISPTSQLAREAWLNKIRSKAQSFEKPGILLFVHGYNVNFYGAAKRAAQLSYDLAFPGPTVFFAWPSDASIVKYARDGRDAENSWQASAKLLSDLVEALPSGPIYVVAHSMGNRVMLGGLASLFEDNVHSRRAFKELVLAAPDVDQDYYRLNWARHIENRGPRITLYASSHDLALGSSEFLHGGARLGTGGPALYLDPDIDSIDASMASREFFGLNHSYFGDTRTVLADIFFLIRQNLRVEKRPYLTRSGLFSPYRWELR